MEMYRQGDVLLRRIEKVAGKPTDSGEKVLALGETTGHKHILRGNGVQFFASASGQVQVQVTDTAELVHEEHARIEIPKGSYEVVLQREFDLLDGVRQVAD